MKAALVLICLCCSMPAWALKVVWHQVPSPAQTALLAAAPDLQPAEMGEVHLFWRPEAYLQQRDRLQQPALVLMAYPGQVALRPQDQALFWAPDLGRQLQLAQQLRPRLQRVGVITRPSTMPLVRAVQAAHPGIEWQVVEVGLPLPVRVLTELVAQVDVLIAVPDDQLFSPELARLLLTTAYRQQKAWVGPNEAFVKAGAAATWQVAREALIAAVADDLAYWSQHRRWRGSRQLPTDDLVINAPVIRSLGLRQPRMERQP